MSIEHCCTPSGWLNQVPISVVASLFLFQASAGSHEISTTDKDDRHNVGSHSLSTAPAATPHQSVGVPGFAECEDDYGHMHQ
jgi:hypothetical protein